MLLQARVPIATSRRPTAQIRSNKLAARRSILGRAAATADATAKQMRCVCDVQHHSPRLLRFACIIVSDQ